MTNQDVGSKYNSKKLAAGHVLLSMLSYEERPASRLLALRQTNEHGVYRVTILYRVI